MRWHSDHRAFVATLFAPVGSPPEGASVELCWQRAGSADGVCVHSATRLDTLIPTALELASRNAVGIRPVLRNDDELHDRLWCLWLVANDRAGRRRLCDELPSPGLLLADGPRVVAVWPLRHDVDRRAGIDGLREVAERLGLDAANDDALIPLPGSVGQHGRVTCAVLDLGWSVSPSDVLAGRREQRRRGRGKQLAIKLGGDDVVPPDPLADDLPPVEPAQAAAIADPAPLLGIHLDSSPHEMATRPSSHHSFWAGA